MVATVVHTQVVSTPRLPPLPREKWDEEVRVAMVAGIPAERIATVLSDDPTTHVPNVLTSLMYHPRLAGPFFAFNAVLLRDPALPPRLRELMVLRVAWRSRSSYEWVQHVRLAYRVEISAEEIDAVTKDPPAGDWTPLEADLLAATDQLLDGVSIEDETWARLAEQLSEAELLEVPFVVGTYLCLAMVLNTIGVQLDPDIADIPVPLFPEDKVYDDA
jgi:4-carboxymuconolactone decarboxylase